jgi:hypothetical protein
MYHCVQKTKSSQSSHSVSRGDGRDGAEMSPASNPVMDGRLLGEGLLRFVQSKSLTALQNMDGTPFGGGVA